MTLDGIDQVGIVIACKSKETATGVAAEIGEVAVVEGCVIRIGLYCDGNPSTAGVSALARLAAKQMAGAIEELTAMALTQK